MLIIPYGNTSATQGASATEGIAMDYPIFAIFRFVRLFHSIQWHACLVPSDVLGLKYAHSSWATASRVIGNKAIHDELLVAPSTTLIGKRMALN